MSNKPIISTERLELRSWSKDDVEAMAKISGDPVIMEHFPNTQSETHVANFIDRQIVQQNKRGYCYFAAETKKDAKFIGFIGMSYQEYEAPFTPCTDIGWRLDKKYWGLGYATEGARACLNYAWAHIGLEKVYSIASNTNTPSINVMKKLKMHHEYDFDHSLLMDYPKIKNCALYVIDNPNSSKS